MIKVLVTKTSDWKYKEKMEFPSMNEAVEYGLGLHNQIIIMKDTGETDNIDYGLEIYDDYRE